MKRQYKKKKTGDAIYERKFIPSKVCLSSFFCIWMYVWLCVNVFVFLLILNVLLDAKKYKKKRKITSKIYKTHGKWLISNKIQNDVEQEKRKRVLT